MPNPRLSTIWGSAGRLPARRWPMPTKDATGGSWRDLAVGLIAKARRLYAHEDLGLQLANTVYALDRDHHRPVPVAFWLGRFPLHQSGSEAAYPTGSAGTDSDRDRHHAGPQTRCALARRTALRGRSFLYPGPWLYGLRSAGEPCRLRRLLRHAGQGQPALHAPSFPASQPRGGTEKRSPW